MLTHPTIDLLRSLKLDGMTEAFLELQSQDRAKDLDHAEWLEHPASYWTRLSCSNSIE